MAAPSSSSGKDSRPAACHRSNGVPASTCGMNNPESNMLQMSNPTFVTLAVGQWVRSASEAAPPVSLSKLWRSVEAPPPGRGAAGA